MSELAPGDVCYHSSSSSSPDRGGEASELPEMEDGEAQQIESIIGYSFKDRRLLVQALTHRSFHVGDLSRGEAPDQDRMSYLGGDILNMLMAAQAFAAVPELTEVEMATVRAANVSKERLARAAIVKNIIPFIRHDAANLELEIKDFMAGTERVDDNSFPRLLDILPKVIRALISATHLDSGRSLEATTKVCAALLDL